MPSIWPQLRAFEAQQGFFIMRHQAHPQHSFLGGAGKCLYRQFVVPRAVTGKLLIRASLPIWYQGIQISTSTNSIEAKIAPMVLCKDSFVENTPLHFPCFKASISSGLAKSGFPTPAQTTPPPP
ncbi:hypothetical protein VTI28DRAFT_1057 [Corynascus sepedonium]